VLLAIHVSQRKQQQQWEELYFDGRAGSPLEREIHEAVCTNPALVDDCITAWDGITYVDEVASGLANSVQQLQNQHLFLDSLCHLLKLLSIFLL
jgi:hypothetical protein